MVTKSAKSTDVKKKRTKVKKLTLTKGSVKTLSGSEIKKVRGGNAKSIMNVIKI